MQEPLDALQTGFTKSPVFRGTELHRGLLGH